MPDEKSLFDRLKERGDEVLTQVSAELMQNPGFVKAMEGAIRGKHRLDEAAARAMKGVNIPTRSEFKTALRRIEALEAELAALKGKPGAKAKAAKKAAPSRKAPPGKR